MWKSVGILIEDRNVGLEAETIEKLNLLGAERDEEWLKEMQREWLKW